MKTHIAQWMLSCVLPADRAAAIAGDFAESAAIRGAFWFWSSIIRILISGLGKDLGDRPLNLTRLALSAWVLNLIAMFGLVLLFSFLMVLVLIPFNWLAQKTLWLPSAETFGHVSGNFLGIALCIRCAWVTGRWLARHAPDREVAACIVLCVVQFLVINALAAIVLMGWSIEVERFIASHRNDPVASSGSVIDFLNSNIVYTLTLFAGAIRTRRVNLRLE